MVHIGLIGCGYWGPNLLRNFAKVRECQVVAAADLDAGKLEDLKRLYPALRTTTSAQQLLEATELDAVVIATPISTHYQLAKEALCHGKHVLIEKPMTDTVAQAEELIRLAADNQKVLMIDLLLCQTDAGKRVFHGNRGSKNVRGHGVSETREEGGRAR